MILERLQGTSHARVYRHLARRVGEGLMEAEIWRAGGLAPPDWVKGERVVIRQGLFEGYQGIFDVRLSGARVSGCCSRC